MRLKYLKYEEILEKIGLTSLENRRKIKILDLVQRIRLNFNCIPNEWHSRLAFTNNDRNGVYIRSNKIRIYKCEKPFLIIVVKFLTIYRKNYEI